MLIGAGGTPLWIVTKYNSNYNIKRNYKMFTVCFLWKKSCLYHVRQGEKPYYYASRWLTSGCNFQQCNWQTRDYWVQQALSSTTGFIKHAWARLPSIGIEWDSAIIELAYLFAGLVTITQFSLVHRILQGVEHTDPTEWSNSHLSIRDKFMLTVRRTVSVQRLFTFSFR